MNWRGTRGLGSVVITLWVSVLCLLSLTGSPSLLVEGVPPHLEQKENVYFLSLLSLLRDESTVDGPKNTQ